MRKVSKKLAKEHWLYSKLRKKWLVDNQMCQAKIHKCSLKSTDVHHMKGRGKYLLNTDTWLSVCRSCHNWIETHPEEAKELGFSLSKLL